MGYGQPLKDIVEEQANQDYIGIEDIKRLYPGANTRTTDNGIQGMHYLFDEHDMRLIEDGTRVKTWRLTKNLNLSLTNTIMHKATPDIEMRTKVVYSFEAEIHRGGGDIIVYGRTKSSTGTLASLQEIEDFIEQCEMKRLDLEDNDFGGKAYLPAERTIETPGAYQGMVVFKHVQIKLVLSNEPLLGCSPLPDWLLKKRCIYAVDSFDDNLCVSRCLAIYTRRDVERRSEFVTREALTLAREYYGNDKLKQQDVRTTRLVDFEGIAKKFSINIRVYEPKKNSEKAPWRQVYGQNQYKAKLDTINLGMFGGHCFYIKNMAVLCQNCECLACKQIFNQSQNLDRHLTDGSCNGGKTKLICNGKKFKCILNSSEKVFYGGKPNSSYSACQWIEHMSEETGKHIHHTLCGHGGERVIRDSQGHEICKVDGYEPSTKTVYQYHGCKWHGRTCLKSRTNTDENRYVETKGTEEWIKKRDYNVISVWECEKTTKKKQSFKVQFRPYAHYIVFDFEVLQEALNECRTSDLTYKSSQKPITVAIYDSLTDEPSFIVHENLKILIIQFVAELERRQKLIVKAVKVLYPEPEDFGVLPDRVQKDWERWINQVPVIGFNSGKYV